MAQTPAASASRPARCGGEVMAKRLEKSAGAVLNRLPGPTFLGLELVERRPHRRGVVPLGAAEHILSAAAPHHPVLAGAEGGDAGVFAHVPEVLPTAPWVTLPDVGQLFSGEDRALQLHVRAEQTRKLAGLDVHVMASNPATSGTTATTHRRRHPAAQTARLTLVSGTPAGKGRRSPLGVFRRRKILRRIHVCEQRHWPIHVHRFVLMLPDDGL